MFQARPFGFGATNPAFGGTAFGATPTPAFGAGATPAFGASPTPAFGAPSGAPTPAFGANTPAFGTSTPAFGAAATPAFGTSTPAFGATSMTPFGGASTTPFGGAAATPAFGPTNPTPSAFGSTAPATFGGFGAAPTSAFGSTAPSTFGAPSNPAGFGGGTTTSSFAFGAGFGATAPSSSPFAATAAPSFSSPFGATATTATPSAAPGSMFGAAPAAFGGFGQPTTTTTTGTGNPKFQVTAESDPNGTVNHQSVTAMAAYNKKSFEELRWEDYQAGKKNSTSPAVAASGAAPFGTPSTFGTTAANTGAGFTFPSTTTSVNPFGTTATPAATSPTTTFGAFGTSATNPTTTPAFGSTAATTFPTFTPSLSAAPNPSTTANPFGFPSSSATNPFGAPATATATTSPFGMTGTTTFPSTFAPATTTATAPAFGSTTTPINPFGGATSTTTTSLFNPSTTSNTFNHTAFTMPTNTATTSNMFNPNPSLSTIPTPLFSSAPSTATTSSSLFSSFTTPGMAQLGGTQPTFSTPSTSIASPPVGAPLPMFTLPTGTPNPIPQISTPIPSLSFTPRTPTPQKNSYVSSHPRSLPARSGSLVRIRDSPSYGGGRLFSEDKGFSPSGIHITPENLSLRSATPSKPRADIKKLNLPPFEERPPTQSTKAPLDATTEPSPPSHLLTPIRPQPTYTLQTTPARSRAEANEVPTLRNPHYYTKPAIDQLREMGPTELSRIDDFVLGCADLGFVRWHGKTDIRGLNLDDIVTFEKKAVTVYPEQGIYPKPPVGEGLNKPATITLLHVLPKKQETADKYAQMIANTTKKFDGKLLGYDPERGIWEFEVRHFSRYGLSDDDEEPDSVRDTELAAPSLQVERAADISIQSKVTAPKAPLSTPDPPQSFSSQSSSALQMSVYAPSDSKVNRNARLSGLSTRGLLFTEEPGPVQQPTSGYKGKSIPSVPPFSQSFIAKEHERTERAKSTSIPQFKKLVPVQNTVPVFTSLPQAEKEASLIVHTPQLRLKKLALEDSVTAKASHSQSDVGLTMGRSFRVGWGPNGRLLRISSTLGTVTVSRPALSTATTATPAIATSSMITDSQISRSPSIDSYIVELLQTHLSHSRAQYGPHFTLKDLHANIQANIKICRHNDGNGISSEKESYRQHLFLVWTLVYSLWGEIPDGAFPLEIAKQLPPDVDDDSDSTERLTSVHLSRKLHVSKWLTQALQGPVEESIKLVKSSGGGSALAILHYLTGRQISPAVAIAQRSRDYRLAVLLTQTWTSSLQLLGTQLEQWEVTNTLPFIDKQLLSVYKLLAGDAEHVGTNIPEICNDWLRCFALHFWYKHVPSAAMPDVLRTYDVAVEQGSASAAVPWYLKNKAKPGRPTASTPGAKDSLYRLLQLYASTTHHQAIPEEAAGQSGPVITTTRFAPPTSSLPTTLLLSAVDPANQTQDPMDFSLAWHLYTVLRIVPELSSVVDLPVPHRLHTSYAAQLEALGHWQWAIYVLLHINFDSHKTLNGEWGFASGRQEAVSSILERHAPSISEKHYQFLTQELRVPASWVDAAVGRYLIYERQYQVGVQRLLRAGEWNEAHRAILSYLVPLVVAISTTDTTNAITEKDLVSLLETLQPNYTYLVDPTWNMGGHIYLAYLQLKHKLGSMPIGQTDGEDSNTGAAVESVQRSLRPAAAAGGAFNLQALVKEIPNIYSLCELVAQWSQKNMTSASHQQRPATSSVTTSTTMGTTTTTMTTMMIGMSTIATYLGHALLALAQTHRDAMLPHRLQALPLPPDVRAYIMEDYFHTMVYAV